VTLDAKELTCRELSELLAGYFAGELDPDVRMLFEEHLVECPECVAYLRSYAETMRLAKDAYEADAVPVEFPEELMRAILVAREPAPLV